jgi:hypothetical protein
MPLASLPRAVPAFLVPALLLLTLALSAFPLAPRPAAAEDGFAAYPCPIEGQENAVVLGHDGSFQAACLALSRPHDAGPWTAEDAGRVDGSSRYCPRAVLTVLDQSGAMTIRFLPAAKDSFLSNPAACCRAAEISVDVEDGRVRIGTTGPGLDCLGGSALTAHEDLYRWDGAELKFIESRSGEAKPAQ